METELLVAAAAISGLMCPAMMWWNRRRGRAACCVPTRDGEVQLDELRRRGDEVAAAIAGHPEAGADASVPRPPAA
jgi:hypothetical protein